MPKRFAKPCTSCGKLWPILKRWWNYQRDGLRECGLYSNRCDDKMQRPLKYLRRAKPSVCCGPACD